MKKLLLPACLLLPATPTPFPLDAAGGVAGLTFGQPVPAALRRSIGLLGARRRTTQVYTRPPGDTARVNGLPGQPTYWFRLGRFEGVTINLPGPEALAQARAHLTALYGPARSDTVPSSWYWLGQRSYVLLEEAYPRRRGAIVMLASLTMLNEQVHETAVRARARRQLGWQPDSAGLPRQFPNR